MVHLRNSSHTPKDANALLMRARALIESDGVIVRDTRVSSRYIEYDISIPGQEGAGGILTALEAISPVASSEEVIERHIAKDEAIENAKQAFNDEKYWNAHELLEGVWKSASGAEKDTLNAIILVAAAFVHDEKDEPDVCISILRRAIGKLGESRGQYHGIDLDGLASKVSEIIESGRIARFAI